MDCWLSSGRLDGLTYLKVHEVEATELLFWFYGLFILWQMKRWHNIKNHHQVSLLKDKDDPQSVDGILSQTRGRNKMQLVLCQHSASLSLFLMSLPASASVGMFFTSSSWNEWTLLQQCGKLAGEMLHSATPALSFFKCIMHFLFSSAHCKKKKKINSKALTC